MDDHDFEEDSFEKEDSKETNPIIGKKSSQSYHKLYNNNPLPFGKSIEDVITEGFVMDWNAELKDSEDFQMAVEQTPLKQRDLICDAGSYQRFSGNVSQGNNSIHQ